MNKIKKFYKRELINISLSSSFIARSRCVRCGDFYKIYYFTYNPALYITPKILQDVFSYISKHVKRMGTDHYLKYSPKLYYKLGNFSQGTGFKKFVPKIHHTRGIDNDSHVTEYLTCNCGHSSLGFVQKGIKNRPEIFNRKSHRTFHSKIKF